MFWSLKSFPKVPLICKTRPADVFVVVADVVVAVTAVFKVVVTDVVPDVVAVQV